MSTYQVQVVDGAMPPDFSAAGDMEPRLTSTPELSAVTQELMRREPLFHRPEFGRTRADFEKMTAPEFWEVGASGRRYSRKFVLDTLELRYRAAFSDVWEIRNFHCTELAPDTFLATYTLSQRGRITQRATIWKRAGDSWQILYHQGTSCVDV